jgi:hypothetical protein
MLGYSLYPSDSAEDFAAVVQQAQNAQSKRFFTSLHMPEGTGLEQFMAELKKLHELYHWTFFADISPETLNMLNLRIADLDQLQASGIHGLRLDFGFAQSDVRQLAQAGFMLAVNASTISAAELESFALLDVIGWHNYYPRVETGLSAAFFEQQNKMLTDYTIPIYSFIPGINTLRAPLYEGLPTLEHERGRNPYINYLEQRLVYGIDNIFLAEGTIDAGDLEAITLYEREQIITIPCAAIDEVYQSVLLERNWDVRIEETDYSWRLEGTRGMFVVAPQEQSATRRIGALQMDTTGFGRYAGEIHLLKKTLPVDGWTIEIGQIKADYVPLVHWLGGHPKVRFVL